MNVPHSRLKIAMEQNFIRSAKAPQISAGVMMKNMPWKAMWVSRGMPPSMGSIGVPVASSQSRWTSFMKRYWPLPTYGLSAPSPPKASE